jgi:hypothetical protein
MSQPFTRFVRRFRLVLVTGAAVIGMAVTAFGVNTAAAAPRHNGSPVGSWLVTVTGPDFPTTTVVASLSIGGVLTQIDLNPPTPYTALGTWALTGTHSFTDSFWQLALIPDQVVFHVTGNGQIRGGDLTGTFTFEVFNPSDLTHPIPNVTGSGQFKGHRIDA